ncbi:hypothetical protein RSAG8_03628, partial [Rhizoctonia solani AG-8 WAC10335]
MEHLAADLGRLKPTVSSNRTPRASLYLRARARPLCL